MKKCNECGQAYDDSVETCNCGQQLSLVVFAERLDEEHSPTQEYPKKESALKNIGYTALGIVMVLAFLSLPVLFITGGAWLAEKVLPWLMYILPIVVALNVWILIPLAIIPPTRGWAGLGFYISSYIFGLTGWFMGLLLSLYLWGWFAVFIGLFLLGVGVVPVAMLATLFNGMWYELGMLFLAVVLTFGTRLFGIYLMEKSEYDKSYKISKAALWSFICGITGICLCLPAIPAIILGIIGLVNLKKSGGTLKGYGMAITGLILGALAIILYPVLFLLGFLSALKSSGNP